MADSRAKRSAFFRAGAIAGIAVSISTEIDFRRRAAKNAGLKGLFIKKQRATSNSTPTFAGRLI
jgi:hypothetical protein